MASRMRNYPIALFLACSLQSISAPAVAETLIPLAANTPQILVNDSRVHLAFGLENLVIAGGLQPSMLYTREGSIVVQSHQPEPSLPSKRYVSHSAMGTVVSHNNGQTWSPFLPQSGHNGVNMEGGAIQLRDGVAQG